MNFGDKKNYLVFITYFLLFGFIISTITSFLNYHFMYRDVSEHFHRDTEDFINLKKSYIKHFITSIERDITAINSSNILYDYLNGKREKETLTELLFSHAYSNPNYFQVRYLNADGMEVVRVERDRNNLDLRVVPDNELQDKSHRYYFKESSKLLSNRFWHSKLDLNIEHHEIEKPIRPTFRVSSPVIYRGEFFGIVIINIDMKSFLDSLSETLIFNTYLVDKDGNFILHHNRGYSFGKYLNSNQRLIDDFPENYRDILNNREFFKENIYSVSLEDIFQNGEGIKFILVPKNEYIRGVVNKNMQYILSIFIAILIFSIPTGALIAIRPANLQSKLNRLIEENKKYMDIIDRYIPITSTDIEGHIIKVTSAFTKLSGYKRGELIGRTHSIVASGDEPNSKYAEIWKRIMSGLIWSGEFQNRKRDGSSYWVKSYILPEINNNIITGFTGISIDITDKKLIEKISEEDKLTKLFNRVKIDAVIEAEISRCERYNHELSLIIIDMDHFKSVNDTFGHQAGDSVLIEFSNILRHGVRKTDIVGRWGGEEFVIICIDTDLSGATKLAENIREKIDKHEFDIVGHKTASFGVSSYAKGDTENRLIKRADDALYRAKERGRNLVEFI